MEKTYLVAFFLLMLSASNCSEHTKNSKVVRKIDLSTQVVKVETVISSDSFGSTYLFAAEPGYEENIAFIGASSKSGEESPPLPIKQVSKNGKQLYEIAIGGRPSSLVVTAHYTHKLVPYPSEITQSERQYLRFTGNANFYSPYATDSVETQIRTANNNILDFTNLQPVNKQDSTITYGPFNNVPAFTNQEVSVHYENNAPFLTIVDMLRHIEVSHWGNIAVEEKVHVVHSGAKLKGSFSRYEYQRKNDGVSSVRAYKTVLPASAKDVYYRDDIGNISTSNLRELIDSVEIELRPRFPLFGGWNTDYVIGYNVPSYEYLYSSGNQYALRIRFIDHVHDDMVVDRVTVKIVLPELATNLRYEAPYPVVEGAREVVKTYLDTVGRPVLVLSKANLVDQHIQELVVRYEFASWSLIREPLMATAFFLVLFLTVILAVRLNFSIVQDASVEMKQRLGCLTSEIVGLQDKRSALYQCYEDAINKFKAGKDHSRFKSDVSKVTADHKALTKKVAELVKAIRSDAAFAAPADLLERLDELQRQDGRLSELLQIAASQAEALVSGRITKQQYLDADVKHVKSRDEAVARIEQLVDGL